MKEQYVTFLTELIIHTTKRILKEDRNLHCSVVFAVHMDILKVDALKDHVEKAWHDQKKSHSIVI